MKFIPTSGPAIDNRLLRKNGRLLSEDNEIAKFKLGLNSGGLRPLRFSQLC